MQIKMLKKLDSVLLYVRSTTKTAEFYEKLGFTITELSDEKCVVKLAQFSFVCHDQSKVHFTQDSKRKTKGAGVFFYVEVVDVDKFYKSAVSNGLEPSSKPTNWPWGNREFVVRDPDGYKLVFYKKLK